jgi:hypothetical protein
MIKLACFKSINGKLFEKKEDCIIEDDKYLMLEEITKIVRKFGLTDRRYEQIRYDEIAMKIIKYKEEILNVLTKRKNKKVLNAIRNKEESGRVSILEE